MSLPRTLRTLSLPVLALLVFACAGADDPTPTSEPTSDVQEQLYRKSTKPQLRQNCDSQQLTQEEVAYCTSCVTDHPNLACSCQIECFPSGLTTKSCNCFSNNPY